MHWLEFYERRNPQSDATAQDEAEYWCTENYLQLLKQSERRCWCTMGY